MKRTKTNPLHLNLKKYKIIPPICISSLSNSASRRSNMSKLTVRIPSVENEIYETHRFRLNEKSAEIFRPNLEVKKSSYVLTRNYELNISPDDKTKWCKNREKKRLKNKQNMAPNPKNDDTSGVVSVVMIPLPHSTYKNIERERNNNRIYKLKKRGIKIDKENIAL